MNRRTITILILAAALAAVLAAAYFIFAFNYFRPIPKEPGRKAKIEDDIYIDLLAALLEESPPQGDSCLTINDSDPSNELLARLEKRGLKFKKGSRCCVDSAAMPSIFGKHIDFREGVEWVSGRSVRVNVRYSSGLARKGWSGRCTLEKKWGKWIYLGKIARGNL